MRHEQFQALLDTLVKRSGVGQEVLGQVLARTSLRAPDETSRVEIATGDPAARRPVDQHSLPQGTVSKAVKALMEEGLLEDGERLLRNQEGRTLSPIRFGSRYAVGGVKVVQSHERPRRVTTALLGLDSSRRLGTADAAVDSWDQVAALIHKQVASLKSKCDRERAGLGLDPLLIFGVGVEVGAPVYEGKVMPLSSDGSPVPLAEMLQSRFEADTGFGRPVPVIVENDVNALAVLAIHQKHYTDPDLVVVGVFNEGVGGGLVMDGRLRRGGNGRAMEIGHLAVASAPGGDRERRSWPEAGAGDAGFGGRCYCGRYGHIDTLAAPSRIEAELGEEPLEKISEIDQFDPGFSQALKVFTQSGAALGRALAHVSNTVNPRKVIMYLPAPLAKPRQDTAGAAYLTEVTAEATSAFGASDKPDYLTIQAFPEDPKEVALLGAKAAAVCVLESFIEHALRLDGCKPGPRRIVTSTQAPAGAAV